MVGLCAVAVVPRHAPTARIGYVAGLNIEKDL